MRKLTFYSKQFAKHLVPKKIYESQLATRLAALSALSPDDAESILDRVNYYNQLDEPFSLTAFETFTSFKLSTPVKSPDGQEKKRQSSAYFYDFREHLVYFPSHARFQPIFCDLREIPPEPAFVKSRNIQPDNQNAVLLKLDKARHFRFFPDRLAFTDKKPTAVFRGPCYQPHRQRFIQSCYDLPNTNFGDTRDSEKGKPHYKSYLSPHGQMQHKYIVSVEGNDVATNLKWILDSNSLCFMTRPTCETWFMEGRLKPNYHYVLLKDDYSDLSEKMAFYENNPDKALTIIKQANAFVAPFKDHDRETLISLLVMQKYFNLQSNTQ